MTTRTIGMIFAAGVGSRLAPLTLTTPKALVPVDGIPMLERVIRRFTDYGITDIVVNVHHFANKIIEFLKVNNNFNVNIHISDETDKLLDTGGALVNAADFFQGFDNILIHNADIVSDVNLGDMLHAHMESKADATLLVSDRKSSRVLYFDQTSLNLLGWENLTAGRCIPSNLHSFLKNDIALAFGGIHLFSTRCLPLLSSFTNETAFSIIPFYAEMCRNLKIRGYIPRYKYFWFDIGSPEKLLAANKALSHTN